MTLKLDMIHFVELDKVAQPTHAAPAAPGAGMSSRI